MSYSVIVSIRKDNDNYHIELRLKLGWYLTYVSFVTVVVITAAQSHWKRIGLSALQLSTRREQESKLLGWWFLGLTVLVGL